jgi:hypothetical protein
MRKIFISYRRADKESGVSWRQEVLHAIDRNHQYGHRGTCPKGSR